jgi:hypothetical protein
MSKDAPGREDPDHVPATVLVAANDRLQALRTLLTSTVTPTHADKQPEATTPAR